MMTAFEVFEHFPDPIPEIEQMLRYSRNILFTEELIPTGVKAVADWWYFVPEGGQHVSFYTRKSLELIARRFGLYITSGSAAPHLLSEKPVNEGLFRLLCKGRVAGAIRAPLRRFRGRSSLTLPDFDTSAPRGAR